MSGAKVTGLNYVLAVPEAMATARWRMDTMKFHALRGLGGSVFVKRGSFAMMLGQHPTSYPLS